MAELKDLFMELDRHSAVQNRDKILRSVLKYPGSKSRSVLQICEHLPYRNSYVEPFGGSAAILLARQPSRIEVYNDRYGGVVAFYRCLRDVKKSRELVDLLEMTVHSREDFVWCKETWDKCAGDVDRAARWYYMLKYSFGGLARNFGRSTSGRSSSAGTVRSALKRFPDIHARFKNVQVENQDWYQCMKDYDSPETVFYIDPPYIDSDAGIYKHKMSVSDHRDLLDLIFTLEGFVALSGYDNTLYGSYDWDERHSWETSVSLKSQAFTESNRKEHLKGQLRSERETAHEVLWIKE